MLGRERERGSLCGFGRTVGSSYVTSVACVTTTEQVDIVKSQVGEIILFEHLSHNTFLTRVA